MDDDPSIPEKDEILSIRKSSALEVTIIRHPNPLIINQEDLENKNTLMLERFTQSKKRCSPMFTTCLRKPWLRGLMLWSRSKLNSLRSITLRQSSKNLEEMSSDPSNEPYFQTFRMWRTIKSYLSQNDTLSKHLERQIIPVLE